MCSFCIPRSFLVINVCNQGKTLCSPCITVPYSHILVEEITRRKKEVEMFKPLQYITLSLEENLLYLGSSLTSFLISFQELVNVTSPVSSSSSLEHNQVNTCSSEEPLKNPPHTYSTWAYESSRDYFQNKCISPSLTISELWSHNAE